MEKINRSKRSLIISPFFILFILSILRNIDIYSQTDTTNQKKWSFGIYGGTFIPNYDLAFYYKISPTLGLKAEYKIKPYFSVYVSSAYSFLNPQHDYVYIPEEIPQISARSISANIGIKYNFMEAFKNIYLKLGGGHYYFEYRYKNLWDNTSYNTISNNFGFNFGLGVEIPIGKNLKIEFGGDYYYINNKGPQTNTYFVFYFGISFKL